MGWVRGMEISVVMFCGPPSPTVMGERPVGLGHAVRILTFLDRVSAAVGCIEQLRRQALGHGLFVALARRRDDPSDAKRLPPGQAHFDGDLIRRAAHASRANLGWGHAIPERLL